MSKCKRGVRIINVARGGEKSREILIFDVSFSSFSNEFHGWH